ncbi:MAG: signal peptidase II [bacterium]|nr:signal peptidase II [bacterium]
MSFFKNNLTTITERIKKHSFGFWLVMVFVLIGIDQLTKLGAEKKALPIFFNYNFAFSLPLSPLLMYFVYAIVFVVIIFTLYRTWKDLSVTAQTGWALIVAGGLSNIFERIILGYVRDFIPVLTGILNVADFFIIAGMLIALWSHRQNTLS